MDGNGFSNIVASSLRIVGTAKVEKIRDASKGIIREISSRKGLFVVHGLRGVGKTTVLGELSKEKESVYLSGDVVLKHGADFLELLHHAENAGFKTFLIDEVHAIPNWEKDVKIFFDETRAKIVVTGSSACALKTKSSELSRRATLFELRPLSFREYLIFKTGREIQKISLQDILNEDMRMELTKSVLGDKNEFENYLKKNALPASFFENRQEVYLNIVERVIRFDLESLRAVDINYADAAFKIIKFVATSSPGEVSYTKLANSINRSMKFTKEAISLLALAGLLYIIPPYGTGHKAIRSEDKLLMPLSFRNSLCESYGLKASEGALREDFFIQHVKEASYVKTGSERRTPDFMVKDFVFEIGGPNKGWEQLKNQKNAFLVKEELTTEKNEIPLYLFGLLY